MIKPLRLLVFLTACCLFMLLGSALQIYLLPNLTPQNAYSNTLVVLCFIIPIALIRRARMAKSNEVILKEIEKEQNFNLAYIMPFFSFMVAALAISQAAL